MPFLCFPIRSGSHFVSCEIRPGSASGLLCGINHDGPSQLLLFHKRRSLSQPKPCSPRALFDVRSAQAQKSKINIPFEFSVTLTNTSNLPGINTMGLSMARVDIASHGLMPPQPHPRASEVITYLESVIHVGFVDTSNRLFTQILRTGESFVFPRGLIHYMYNIDSTRPASSLSRLSSQNPGVQISSISNFVSKPQIPDDVLRKAFMITGQDIAKIRANLGG